MYRLILLLIALLVAGAAATSCGGDPASDETPKIIIDTDSDREFELELVATQAVNVLGDPATAAYAILKAYDRGYSIAQIVAAIDVFILNADGTIDDNDPVDEPQGSLASNGYVVFASKHNDSSSSQSPTTSADMDQWFAGTTEEQSSAWMTWLIGAASIGYNAEQLTDFMSERIALGEPPVRVLWFPAIVDDKGAIVKPAKPLDWMFEERSKIDKVREALEKIGERKVEIESEYGIFVLTAVAQGWPINKITEAILFGDIFYDDCPTQLIPDETGQIPTVKCVVIEGEYLPPGHPDRKSSSQPTSTPAPKKTPEVRLPLTLAGVGTFTQGGPKARNDCPSVADATITLEPDGTVTGKITYDVVSLSGSRYPDGTLELECHESVDSGSFDISGTHENGSITAGPETNPTWFTGDFDASGGSLSGRQINTGNFFGDDGYTEFEFPELEK